MKKSKVKSKLEKHLRDKTYTRLTRKAGMNEHISTGYILGMSDELVLIQETDDFRAEGYQLFPLSSIKHVRYNKFDKTAHRILTNEGIKDTIGLKYDVDLSSWKTAAEDLMKTELCVISECEHEDQEYFCIGQIKEVGNKSLSIQYFNPEGILDEFNTKHKFKHITKLSFDDQYANVFFKYVKTEGK